MTGAWRSVINVNGLMVKCELTTVIRWLCQMSLCCHCFTLCVAACCVMTGEAVGQEHRDKKIREVAKGH